MRQFTSTIEKNEVADIFRYGAVDLSRLIASGDLSSRFVVEKYFERIELLNPQLHPIIRTNKTSALKQASYADVKRRSGTLLGPLHGVPVTLKDVHDTEDMETTHCHRALAGRLPEKDGTVAARLRKAGAIIIGKTNFTHYPENPYSPPQNPWGSELSLPGSSAASAVAVACSLSPLDIASDIGGSMIVPASFCGVYAMRLTERRVPVGDSPIDDLRIWRYFMAYGPVARCIDDLHLAAKLITGPDGHDTEVPEIYWIEQSELDISKVKLAWCTDFGNVFIEPELEKAIRRFMTVLDNADFDVSQVNTELSLVKNIHNWSQLVYEYLLPVGGKHFKARGRVEPTLRNYLALMEERDQYIRHWEKLLSHYDVLCIPAFGSFAWPKMGSEPPKSSFLFSALSAASGLPSIVIPIGLTASNKPLCIQILSKRWSDEKLMKITKDIVSYSNGFVGPTIDLYTKQSE